MLTGKPRCASLGFVFLALSASACSGGDMIGAGSKKADSLDQNSGSNEIVEDQTADEPMQVSGAFLTECGLALEHDVPAPAASGMAWIGCGVVDAQGGRPETRPSITKVDVNYVDGTKESPGLLPPVTEAAWDVIMLASASKKGGISKILVTLEHQDIAETARIVGLNDKRYSAYLTAKPPQGSGESTGTDTATGTGTGTDTSLLGTISGGVQDLLSGPVASLFTSVLGNAVGKDVPNTVNQVIPANP